MYTKFLLNTHILAAGEKSLGSVCWSDLLGPATVLWVPVPGIYHSPQGLFQTFSSFVEPIALLPPQSQQMTLLSISQGKYRLCHAWREPPPPAPWVSGTL